MYRVSRLHEPASFFFTVLSTSSASTCLEKRAQFTPTEFDAVGIALAWDSDCPGSLAFGLSTSLVHGASKSTYSVVWNVHRIFDNYITRLMLVRVKIGMFEKFVAFLTTSTSYVDLDSFRTDIE